MIKEMFIFYALFVVLCLFPKFCSGCFRQASFCLGDKKKWSLVAVDRELSNKLIIVWEFAWADSELVALDE